MQQLPDEIAVLKDDKAKLKASGMEAATETPHAEEANGKRPGSAKRSKSQELTIHETIKVVPRELLLVLKRPDILLHTNGSEGAAGS
jgi:hypothetical protein